MDDIRPTIPQKPRRFLDQVREAIRQKGLSYRTEQTYVVWIRRYVNFHGKKHPRSLGLTHIEEFLNFLAITRQCSPNTQRTALNALIFLYRTHFGLDTKALEFTPAKAYRRLPVVYSREEIAKVLQHLNYPYRLIVEIMYGSGLRQAECLSLRIKDIDFSSNNIFVRAGKGNKDRTSILPGAAINSLEAQIEAVLALHKQDLLRGFGRVYLPHALERKSPNMAIDPGWQFLFPSTQIGTDPRSGVKRRHHLHHTALSKKLRKAFQELQIFKPARSHNFRHSFATHLLEAGYDHCRCVCRQK